MSLTLATIALALNLLVASADAHHALPFVIVITIMITPPLAVIITPLGMRMTSTHLDLDMSVVDGTIKRKTEALLLDIPSAMRSVLLTLIVGSVRLIDQDALRGREHLR